MARHLLLSRIILHHVKHASQTFHVITFQSLNLVKMIMRVLLRKFCILNLRDQLSTNSLFTQGTSFVFKYFLVIGQLLFKGLGGILSGKTCLCLANVQKQKC